jgi:hypothetical protein
MVLRRPHFRRRHPAQRIRVRNVVLACLPKPSGTDHANYVTTLEEMERRHLLDVLDTTQWVITGKNGVTAILGLGRITLYGRVPGARRVWRLLHEGGTLAGSVRRLSQRAGGQAALPPPAGCSRRAARQIAPRNRAVAQSATCRTAGVPGADDCGEQDRPAGPLGT